MILPFQRSSRCCENGNGGVSATDMLPAAMSKKNNGIMLLVVRLIRIRKKET